MDETYERQLEAVAGQLPGGPCLVALIPTIAPDQAAGLAGDLSQLVGRERAGHTILLSLEDAPAALDHEIGVEGGRGLSDILAGRITMAQGAAHGRARGYIYVPAGEAPAPGTALARSAAFRSLCVSAVARGATVLAFGSEDAFAGGAMAGDEADDADPATHALPIAGVVWLGAAPTTPAARKGATGARTAPPWRTFGAVLPPDAAPVAGAGGSPAEGVKRPILTGAGRRARRRRQRRRDRLIIFVLVAAFMTVLAATAYMVLRPAPIPSKLPERDSHQLAPKRR